VAAAAGEPAMPHATPTDSLMQSLEMQGESDAASTSGIIENLTFDNDGIYGGIALRQTWRPESSLLRATVDLGGASVALRAVRTPESAEGQGGLQYGGGGWRFGGGHLSVRQGFGLLAAGAGAWRGLGAGCGLLASPADWRGYGGAPDRRAVIGGGVERAGRNHRIYILRGRTPSTATRPARELGLYGVSWRSGGSGISALVLSEADARGWSLDLRRADGRLSAVLELSGRREDATEAALSAAGALRCDLDRLRLDLQYAVTPQGPASPLALRPACLAAWGDRGWALSIAWRPGPGLRVGFLGAASRGAPDPLNGNRRTLRRTGEVDLAWRRPDRSVWSLRLRSVTDGREGWTDRSPWLPAVPERRKNRAFLALRWSGGRAVPLRITFRHLRLGDQLLADPFAADDRSLLTAKVRRVLSRRWELQAEWARAWGGSADLMSVSAPAPGLLHPQHWGHWAAGYALGLGRRGEALNLGLAIGARQPKRVGDATDAPTWDYEVGISARLRSSLAF